MKLEVIIGLILLIIIIALSVKNNKRHLTNDSRHSANEQRIIHSEDLIKKLETKIADLSIVIGILEDTNKKLQDDLDNTKKKLNFYANIQEESENLMVKEDEVERNQLLEKAKSEILTLSQKDESFESVTDKTYVLDDEQREAYKYMDFSNKNVFITGKAGTGKSFLIDTFVRTTKKSHIVLAPTGIAALNVGGATLHSTFGYNNLVNLSIDDISIPTIKLKSDKYLVLKNVKTIIIDEISMVRADTFDKIDKILKVINDNDKPFGGKQIIVFGDLFQLPPVVKEQEYKYLMEQYGGIYFYHTNAFKNGNFKFIELSVNHRQSNDQKFFEILNRIREGCSSAEDIAVLNQRVLSDESVYDRYTTLFPTKAEVERVNQARLEALESKEYVYNSEIIRNNSPATTRSLENIFPITEKLRLKVGALVMMVANDPGHRWVNGTLGIVERLSEDTIYVSIDGDSYEVQRCEFTEQEVSYKDGVITYTDVFTVSQYPIVLAYAMTIHKSQGQTYNNIICDVKNCFATGQAYVAFSRCASLDGLHLRNAVTHDSIRVDHEILSFYLSQKNSTNI